MNNMGRAPCCEKEGVKKGPWTPEEDQKLLAYIQEHGHGSWRALPTKAGLQRCGKSCRLRWTNYLRPDIKRGKFSPQEEQTIIQLHALLGNRWSAIATHLPKRTDNEIKNYWNTHLKKRLTKRGIDPATHKPISAALTSTTDGQTKTESNLSHMAQWESARLEAEARLVRESKLRSSTTTPSVSLLQHLHHQLGSTTAQTHSSCSLSLFNKAWLGQGHLWSKSTMGTGSVDQDLESPTSTLTFSGNSSLPIPAVGCCKQEIDHHHHQEDFEAVSVTTTAPLTTSSLYGNDNVHQLISESPKATNEQIPYTNLIDGFTDDLLIDNDDSGGNDNHPNSSNDESSAHGESMSSSPSNTNDDQSSGENGSYDQESKNYWNNILNLVNSSSPSDSPMF